MGTQTNTNWKGIRMSKGLAAVAAVAALGLAGCCGTKGGACACRSAGPAALKTPRIGLVLGGAYNNPDGMALRDGDIWLSVNNIAGGGKPSCIARITPDDKIEKVVDLPVSPETGVSSSLGIAFASDGNLYVSDNQNFAGKGMGKSRVLRVVLDGKRALRVEVVAVGLHAANGIAARGDSVFVNETTFGEGDPMESGTYRFRLAELKAGAPARVDGTPKDPHVILNLKTRGPVKVGANGLCFDGEGNLCVANFGDQEIWKVGFDAAGAVQKRWLFTKVACAESIDGMQYDGEGSIWFADFMGNAVVRVCAKTGKAVVVAKNPPCDGVSGELDSPSECIRRGNKVYVSNIDLTFGPHKADAFHVVSVIDL